MYIYIPKGFEVEGEKKYALKLKKSLFGQRQAGRVWNKHLIEKLKQVGFMASQIYECLFYKGQSVFVLYTDDSILAGPDSKELDIIIEEMKIAELDLSVEGNIADFLEVKIERVKMGKFQPHSTAPD